MWSSVVGNANLSNLSGTLLAGNKDHLLSQAKSDLAKREIHAESPNKCTGDLQNEQRSKAGHYRTYKTNLLNLSREQIRLQEELLRKEKALRDTQVWSKHEMGNMKRAREQQVDEISMQKLRKITRLFNTSLPIAANARTDEVYDWFWRIPGCWTKSLWEIVLRFQSNWDDSEFSFFAQPRQKIAAWYMESIRSAGKRFWKYIFLRLIHLEIFLKEFNLTTCKEIEKQLLKIQG